MNDALALQTSTFSQTDDLERDLGLDLHVRA